MTNHFCGCGQPAVGLVELAQDLLVTPAFTQACAGCAAARGRVFVAMFDEDGKPVVAPEPVQPSLWEQAEERREVGMTTSSDNAGPTWNAQAIELVQLYLRTHDEFFGDDFWEWAEPRGLEFRGRALGAVVRLAAKEGWMVKKGFRPSVRSNLSPKVLWESRLCLA